MLKSPSKTASWTISLFFAIALALCTQAQTSSGSLRGKVTDPAGALVGNASVTAVGPDGRQRTVQTNREGAFAINNLAAGKHTVRASASGFAPFENADVAIAQGVSTSLDIKLDVTVNEEVTVERELTINTDPEANASATVLREPEIEALPDNSEDLAAALQALAGPAAGPSGGEVFVDGFSGGRLPPRDTIREIRINQNPFSSEYDRLGFGRIEIFTKPGTDSLRGEAEFEFEDEALNSRNPFARNRPQFQVRTISGNLGGPVVKGQASYFVDADYEEADNNSLINALILDPNLNPTSLQLAVVSPVKDVEFSPRLDLKLNEDHTLVARYSFSSSRMLNAGLSGFDLLSRAYSTRSSDHTVRLTETAIVNPSTVNEARFQYIHRRNELKSIDESPTVRVLEAFTSGGANVGTAFANEDRFELQNYTSFLRDKHSMKVGVRLRHLRLADSAPNNFAGTFTFTSLDQYRNTIRNLPGAFPTQFSIAGGNPEATIKQTDIGFFAQDDWRAGPELTLSFGLRYEAQTNISSDYNLAPRFGFAYAPGAKGNQKVKIVFRGGLGFFYDRFGESYTLQALRFNGINQTQYLVTNQAILDGVVFTLNSVANVPTTTQLAAFAQPQTTRIVSPNLKAPLTIQAAFGVERQLPFKTTLAATYVNAHTRRFLRSRNINAPINGLRPIPGAGNILQYESTARFDQHQLIVNLRSNFREGISIFGNYAFGGAKSDSDGPGTFPADSYDVSTEYGRAQLDIRHRFVIGGNFSAPFGISLSPFITLRSGVPFNITTGTDINGDTLFTDRPSFAMDPAEAEVIVTRFGALDPTPDPGDTIIPRNFGRGPEFFGVNLRITKEFGFGGGEKGSSATAQGGGGGGGGGRGGINSPFGSGGQSRGGDSDEDSRFKLEFGAQIRNLFNRTNKGTPVGNLRSPFFGESISLAGGFGGGGGGNLAAGNRRIELEVQFSF
ncbi:MAG: TonB-dependent receptor [Acidobacteriota bacterium]